MLKIRKLGTIPKLLFGIFLFAGGITPAVHAIPVLQMYIEGATYDAGSETWITTDTNFKLWVLGDVGAVGTIFSVKLLYAYEHGQSGSVTFTPTTTSLLTDPSTPSAVGAFTTGTGSPPSPVPNGDPFSPTPNVTDWAYAPIGDFNLTDSPIGDFISDYPSTFPDHGQINVYDVTVSGFDWVYFTAYDHYVKKNGDFQYKFVPLSHDAETCCGVNVPEPAPLALLGIGLLGLMITSRRKHIRI